MDCGKFYGLVREAEALERMKAFDPGPAPAVTVSWAQGSALTGYQDLSTRIAAIVTARYPALVAEAIYAQEALVAELKAECLAALSEAEGPTT